MKGAGTAPERIPLIPVKVNEGLVVMHTREEYDRFMRGVDVEAAHAMYAPIELEEPE